MTRRNKTDSSAVLNKVLTDVDGNIIGLKEDQENHLSNNLGTDRDAIGGGSFVCGGASNVSTNAVWDVSNGYAFSFWLKRVSIVYHRPLIFSCGGIFTASIYSNNVDETLGCSISFRYQHDPDTVLGYGISAPFGLVPNGEWVHLGGTFSPTTDGYFCVNGVVQGHTNVNRNPIASTEGMTLLSSNGQDFEVFDLRFFEENIGTQSLVDIYNFKKIPQTPTHHFKLFEGSGDTIYSSSGNKSIGTIMNPLPNDGNWGTQEVYSFADVEGFNQIYTFILDVNDVIEFKIKTSARNGLFLHTGVVGNGDNYWGVFQLGNTGGNFGTGESGIILIDGVDVSSANRNTMAGILSDNQEHLVSIEVSTSTASFPMVAGLGRYTGFETYYYIYDAKKNGEVLEPWLVSRDDTALPELKDIVSGDLHNIGHVPSKTLYANGRCFEGDGTAILTNAGILADFTAEVFGLSNTPVINSGSLSIANLDKVYGLTLKTSIGAVFGIYPLCEIGTTRYDISGNGNHLTVTNPTPQNNVGNQDEYFETQKGFLKPNYIPLLEDGTTFADGTALNDSNAVVQDGESWLNDGTTIEQQRTPRMVSTELDGVKTFAEVTTINNLYVEESTDDKKNIRVFNKTLNSTQNNTESRITNN